MVVAVLIRQAMGSGPGDEVGGKHVIKSRKDIVECAAGGCRLWAAACPGHAKFIDRNCRRCVICTTRPINKGPAKKDDRLTSWFDMGLCGEASKTARK